MTRRPNTLLQEFLKEPRSLPEIDWQTVPFGVNGLDAWEMFDGDVEGWVPVWFPTLPESLRVQSFKFKVMNH